MEIGSAIHDRPYEESRPMKQGGFEHFLTPTSVGGFIGQTLLETWDNKICRCIAMFHLLENQGMLESRFAFQLFELRDIIAGKVVRGRIRPDLLIHALEVGGTVHIQISYRLCDDIHMAVRIDTP